MNTISSNSKIVSPVKRLINPVRRATTYEMSNLSINRSSCSNQPMHKFTKSLPNRTLQYVQKENLIDFIIRVKTHFIPEQNRFIGDYMLKEINESKYIDGKIFMVSCGTGTGKTTFVLQLAKRTNERILFLSNRIANLEQFKLSMKEAGLSNIVVMSYQAMQSNEGRDLRLLDNFTYVVSDEIHYAMADARFNSETNVTLIKLMILRSPIKIMLSATTERIAPLIVEEMLRIYSWNQLEVMKRFDNYELKNCNSIIRKIIGFSALEDLITKIELSDSRWLIFVKSVEQGNDFISKLKKSKVDFEYTFIHRKALDNAEKDSPQALVFNTLIKEKRLIVKLLIATCLLDNGVDIIQEDVKNVVIMSNDPVEFIQMLGRKRCQSNSDFFDLYIFDENYRTIQNAINERMQELDRYKDASKRIKEGHLDRRWIAPGQENDVYRACVFPDFRSNTIRPNYLLAREVRYQLQELYTMRKNDSLQHKINWITAKVKCTPDIVETKLTKIDVFMQLIAEILNITILKKNKELSIAVRLKFGESYIKVFGKYSKNDRKSRVIGLERIKEMISLQNLPIEIEENDESFMFKRI